MAVSKTVGEFRNVNGNLVGWLADGREVDLPRARLRPIQSNNPRAPKFELEGMSPSGRWLNYGGLFKATSHNEDGEIIDFFAGELDDNSWSKPFHIALFGSVDEGFRASWRREQPNRPARARRARDTDEYDDRDERGTDGNDRSYRGGFGDSTAPFQGADRTSELTDEMIPS
ncbi:MAG: DUF736 family protein [Sphingobium sp.]|uniref:DUF736 family protein n=1 Tax=Sphingomonadales TaxID=204457 RepID=UPI000A68CBBB|nr:MULTISPECIES: DUF736 family protein [Sphingomonadaceae]MDF0489240.1 DUF736 family protein [Sphingomonas pollutisoli]MDF0544033.1 DUF736 family protein [Sphingobium arseniciresistens]MDX3899881.1 DUF736 family protein [Sphingobium sp.]